MIFVFWKNVEDTSGVCVQRTFGVAFLDIDAHESGQTDSCLVVC